MQGGWGEGSWERKFLGSDSSPTNSLLPLDPGTNGGVSIYALLIEMGCLACRVEDDSLGHEPGTLGKAKPASGQSPREQRTGLTGLCIKPRDSQSPTTKGGHLPLLHNARNPSAQDSKGPGKQGGQVPAAATCPPCPGCQCRCLPSSAQDPPSCSLFLAGPSPM